MLLFKGYEKHINQRKTEKIMSTKSPIEFKLSDFVPYFGLKNYAKRNTKGIELKNISSDAVSNSLYLFVYNAAIVVGTAGFTIYCGLEKLLK